MNPYGMIFARQITGKDGKTVSVIPENGGDLSAVSGLLPLLFDSAATDRPDRTRVPPRTEHVTKIAECTCCIFCRIELDSSPCGKY